MEQYGLERLLSHLLVSGEDHTDNPEEDDIITGYQDIGRIEILQILGLLRPAQGLKRPQCGGEPGIQRIGILCKVGAAALGTYLRHLLGYDYFTAVIAVICGNPVSPPQLTADTPVADVIRPVEVVLLHTFGDQLDLAVFHSFSCGFDQLIHLNEPLVLYHGLDGGLTTVMGTYVVYMILDLY